MWWEHHPNIFPFYSHGDVPIDNTITTRPLQKNRGRCFMTASKYTYRMLHGGQQPHPWTSKPWLICLGPNQKKTCLDIQTVPPKLKKTRAVVTRTIHPV